MRKNEYTHFLVENIRGQMLSEYSIARYCGWSIAFFGKRSRFNLISGNELAKYVIWSKYILFSSENMLAKQ
jgi:hypothetical protein